MLDVGTKAIDFSLPDANGDMHSLHDYLGQKVVLYFYPKDNTSGCTKQACAFRDHYETYADNNVLVIGISKDSSKSHANFIEKYQLPFVLLSDKNHEVIEQYGAWIEKKLYGKVSMGTLRCTYVIDEAGTIIKTYPKVKAESNAEEVLAFLGLN